MLGYTISQKFNDILKSNFSFHKSIEIPRIMKRAGKNLMLDRMHRGVVYTCLGLTAYGSYLLGLRVYRYFSVIRPQRQAEELKMIQAGASDSSLDKAPTLRP
jgi:hypothetical protein